MKTIQLTRGKAALVDDEDYAHLKKYKWRAVKTTRSNVWYAVCSLYYRGFKFTTLRMHRLICGVKNTTEVDHRDGNGLNNQRVNLRPATRRQQLHNTKRRGSSSSPYKGVHNDMGKWVARITVNDNMVHLGSYDRAEDAAYAYNKAALEYFGEFANINELPKGFKPRERNQRIAGCRCNKCRKCKMRKRTLAWTQANRELVNERKRARRAAFKARMIPEGVLAE